MCEWLGARLSGVQYAAYFALARWTCWNTLFLCSLIQAHSGNLSESSEFSNRRAQSRTQTQAIWVLLTEVFKLGPCRCWPCMCPNSKRPSFWLSQKATHTVYFPERILRIAFIWALAQSGTWLCSVCAGAAEPLITSSAGRKSITSGGQGSVQGRKSLKSQEVRNDLAVMDLPFFYAHWWKLVIWWYPRPHHACCLTNCHLGFVTLAPAEASRGMHSCHGWRRLGFRLTKEAE